MKIQLPETFTASMKDLLGDEYQAYLDSFEEPRIYGLRVNTLKWTPEQCRQVYGDFQQVPWIANGLLYPEERRMAKDPYYYAGLYYLQEPSAMTPASVLPVEPGDRVLDLCAAPGGKSTELGAKLMGKGVLIANDISNSRAKALLKNLELFGISNICVTSETPEKLVSVYPEYFDKILVDAPCSGEGMFRKDADMMKDWLEHGPAYYAPIQKEILHQAVAMLKPGGMMVYSTCTFDKREDEEQILDLLKTYPEMEVVPLPRFAGACDSFGFSGAIRLFPHKIKGEGHFVVLLRKNADGQEAKQGKGGKQTKAGKQAKIPAVLEKEPELKAFLEKCGIFEDPSRFMVREDSIYYLPENFEPAKGIRYLRTGLLVGTLKKGRFEPSQALAMALSPGTFEDCISFNRGDDRVIRYLKGETISLNEGEKPRKGWVLVCVDGFALGFAKENGMNLKNKYYPGWRWM